MELSPIMGSVLAYCHWYCGTALSDRVTIEQFFKAPVINRKWREERTDPELVRFGLL